MRVIQMIDIDYIVNGKKSKKGKSKSNKQQSKDPFKDLFGMLQPAKKSKSKSKQNSGPGPLNPTKIMGVGGMGNIIGDKKTPQQKEFLNKTKLGSGKSIKRFADKDKDGVISGLDCAPLNPNKHGFSPKLLTPEQKQAIAESKCADEAYDKLQGNVSWGTCESIANKMHQLENRQGEVKSVWGGWPGRPTGGSHVVYKKGEDVYDPINKYKGPYDKYKEQFNVQAEQDITSHSR